MRNQPTAKPRRSTPAQKRTPPLLQAQPTLPLGPSEQGSSGPRLRDLALHESYMRLALRAADLGRGRTRPNPVVGCVIVQGKRVVAAGHHARAGGPHAEIVALERAVTSTSPEAIANAILHATAEQDAVDNAVENANANAREPASPIAPSPVEGADVYITLEPCNHHGRTPPCTEALIAAKVGRVFIGSLDHNPHVVGQGALRLRSAGIEVHTGILQLECDAANEGWFKFITKRMPWVVLKAASTLDGAIATSTGDSRWVTSEAARTEVHKLRDTLDAVLVGIGTVLADDPRLTARLPEHPERAFKGQSIRGVVPRDPVRVVVDTHARLPLDARLLTQRSEAPTLIAVGPKAPKQKLEALRRAGAQIVHCPLGKDGRVDLRSLLKELAKRELVTVLVEGGAALHGAFLARGLWDELQLFIAPKLAGKGALTWAGFAGPLAMAQAKRVELRSVERIGEDLLVRARPISIAAPAHPC